MMAKFLIRTLTPIHIGSGESYNKLEYIKNNNEVFIFDLNKIVDFALSKKNIEYVIRVFENNFEYGLNKTIKDLDISIEEIMKFSKYKIKTREELTSEIYTFIRHNNGKIFIPGSSIKGALRTPFLVKFKNFQNDKLFIKVMTTFNKEYNFFVSDIESDFESEIRRVQRFSSKLEAREIVSFKNLDLYIDFVKEINLDDFKKTVNNFYINALENIIKNAGNKIFIEKLEEIKNYIYKNKESIFIQLGFGGSKYTKTVFNKRPPKSFASVDNNQLGWVELKWCE